MSSVEPILQDGIPGVFAARQSRSIRNRDSFLKAGVEALGTMPFDEIKISELAAASGNSVGSFYTRFQDKEAFLRALRTYAVEAIDREHCAEFTAEKLQTLPPEDVLDALVDLMGDIFASRFRGVLRENYTRIMHADDPWAPIRTHAQQVVRTLHDSLSDAFPQYGPEQTKTRLSFCFQIVVGVLQNDLVNNYHVFKLDDGTVLPALKEALRAYMALPVRNKE
ncbi:TetR/AcrR family transcriptional regulator [uncultured Sulfitobacter sp.]|uniref:TetR/AcrR family transcriptional regulator n=1 Tax=uncultured Sulfitobacter sp. TaxID=191468 RepID=UPI00261A0D4F|nr:TetR/AcrR family transcriptional regulator [uncultured Sulfitobacter sp.]